MKAANLMPPDRGRRGPKVTLRSSNVRLRQREPSQERRPRETTPRPSGGAPAGPMVVVLAILIGVLILAAAAVLEHNEVNNRQATLSALSTQLSTEQAQASRLNSHGQVITREREVAAAVQSIAGSRFNWYSALTGFGEVIEPHTYFTSLSYNGTSATATTTPSAATTGPTFTLAGCTGSQNELATVLRQLRQIHGVVSVSESTGAGGVQLSNSSRPSTSRAGRDGYPSTCSDTFSMAVLFAPPNVGNHGR